jgi:glutamate carboxypeptidase
MPESDLREEANQLLPAMLDAVEALVAIESPTENVDACAAVVRAAVGICERWLPAPARIETHGGRPVFRWGPAHPRVLLLGHLDTVWPVGTIERLPFRVDDEVLRGPGVFDMKSGVVQGWAALALARVREDSGVGMLLTTDEETGSHASREVIADASAAAAAVLVLEPSFDGALKTARKGTSWYTVEFAGRAAHAGLDPERGVNALLAAAEFTRDCGQWGDAEAGTTVTPTLMHSGTTANTVPAAASLTLDVRAWSLDEQSRVDRAVRAWQPSVNASGTLVLGGIDRPAMEASHSADLFARARSIAERIGLPPLQGGAVGGASDGNLTAAAGIPTLDGLGAVGDGAHADDEWASVPALADRAALLAALIDSLLDGSTA